MGGRVTFAGAVIRCVAVALGLAVAVTVAVTLVIALALCVGPQQQLGYKIGVTLALGSRFGLAVTVAVG